MIKADLPNLEKCGPYFMNSNNSLKILNTPKLNDIGYDFMSRYKGVIKSEIGKRVKLTTYLDSMDSNEDRNIEKRKNCEDNNLFYSYLYIEPLLGEYKRSYFSEMLKDWKYEFEGEGNG